MTVPASSDFNALTDLLETDRIRNLSLLGFIESSTASEYHKVGGSVLLRGVSDRSWILISSDSPGELQQLVESLTDEDQYFAAVEDWMMPYLTRDRDIVWDLEVFKYILPDDVSLPAFTNRVVSLAPDDARTVYEQSVYREHLSPDYVKDRIISGPSVGIREDNQLVGWALTHDDGAMGFLHVLEPYRKRGYGYRIVVALCEKLRKKGRMPFAYIVSDNSPAIRLVEKIGLTRTSLAHWCELDENSQA